MSIKKRSKSHVISQMDNIHYITIMEEHSEFDKGMVSSRFRDAKLERTEITRKNIEILVEWVFIST